GLERLDRAHEARQPPEVSGASSIEKLPSVPKLQLLSAGSEAGFQ
ncbi:unnamed protein product, partial [marine sediment metagenome]